MRPLLLICVVALVGGARADVGIPDLDPSFAESDSGSIMITPAGSGPTLAERGLTITVYVRDARDTPIVGYPFQDIFVEDDSGELNTCPGGANADGNTDIDGVAEFTGALAGGGHSIDGLQVYLGGAPLDQAPLAIRVNSPDLTGDRTVNLSDIGTFVADYKAGVDRFRSDFVEDGELNIADVGVIASKVGEDCP